MRTKLLLSLTILALLVSSGLPATASQVDVVPNLTIVVRDQLLGARGHVLKGVHVDDDNDTESVLLVAQMYSGKDIKRIRGAPVVTMNGTTLTINGDAEQNRTVQWRSTFTGIQKEDIIPDFNVSQVYRKARFNRDVTASNITIDRVIDLDYDFDSLVSLTAQNKTKRRDFVAKDLTAFVYHTGYAHDALLNDSDGNALGWVFGFRFELTIALFKTSTKQFIGAHTSVDKGHGNMMPSVVRNYLQNHRIQNRIKHKIIGQNESIPAKLDRINWLSLGYNSTYDLDLYGGFYKFSRNALTFMVRVNSTAMALSGVDDTENFLAGIAGEEEMPGFSPDEAEGVETEALTVALNDEGKTLDNVFDETSTSGATSSTTTPSDTPTSDDKVSQAAPSPINFYLVLASLFMIMPLLKVKKNKLRGDIRR